MKGVVTPALDIYGETEHVRVPEDLETQSLHITSTGAEWRNAPRLDEYPAALLVDFYRNMALTRATDREIVKFQRKGLAFGKHLMCTGNEASAVGAASAARPTDWLTLAIRDLGAFLVRGISVQQILA